MHWLGNEPAFREKGVRLTAYFLADRLQGLLPGAIFL